MNFLCINHKYSNINFPSRFPGWSPVAYNCWWIAPSKTLIMFHAKTNNIFCNEFDLSTNIIKMALKSKLTSLISARSCNLTSWGKVNSKIFKFDWEFHPIL